MYLLPILTGEGDIGEVTAGPEIPAHRDDYGDDHSDGDDDHGDGHDHDHDVKVPEGRSGSLLKFVPAQAHPFPRHPSAVPVGQWLKIIFAFWSVSSGSSKGERES